VRILITGATGLLGVPLAAQLLARGDEVLALSRRPEAAAKTLPAGVTVVAGDPGTAGPWQDRVSGCQAVINLAGEHLLGKRWTAAQKEILRRSRVDSAANVGAAIERAAAAGQPPAVLINASAVGYYGFLPDDSTTFD
jgi:NAD dependent epimerase/dehydratase family enzyme